MESVTVKVPFGVTLERMLGRSWSARGPLNSSAQAKSKAAALAEIGEQVKTAADSLDQPGYCGPVAFKFLDDGSVWLLSYLPGWGWSEHTLRQGELEIRRAPSCFLGSLQTDGKTHTQVINSFLDDCRTENDSIARQRADQSQPE